MLLPPLQSTFLQDLFSFLWSPPDESQPWGFTNSSLSPGRCSLLLWLFQVNTVIFSLLGACLHSLNALLTSSKSYLDTSNPGLEPGSWCLLSCVGQHKIDPEVAPECPSPGTGKHQVRVCLSALVGISPWWSLKTLRSSFVIKLKFCGIQNIELSLL